MSGKPVATSIGPREREALAIIEHAPGITIAQLAERHGNSEALRSCITACVAGATLVPAWLRLRGHGRII